MSSACYIVPQSEIEEFDHFVNGKFVASLIDEESKITLDDATIPPFESYLSQDPSELVDMLGGDIDDFPPLEWFKASDDLRTIRALKAVISEQTTSIANKTLILEDLDEYDRVLSKLDSEDIDFHLCIDF